VSVIGFLLVTAAIVARGGYRETALAQMSVKAWGGWDGPP